MKCTIHGSARKSATTAAKLLFAAAWFSSIAAWPANTPSPETAAAAKRVASRCLAQADLDACNDAIRRNPSDPQLLVALADALVRAKRPADAVRHYRRAAALAPRMPGLAAKLKDAENHLTSERTTAVARHPHYSNAAPETQSH